jgi:hypothetical protein
MLQVFYVVQPGASGVGTRLVTVVLRSGCAKGVLVLFISAPESYPRGERRGSGVIGGHRDRVKCARGAGQRRTGARCTGV